MIQGHIEFVARDILFDDASGNAIENPFSLGFFLGSQT
jgi:hypothetical protein